MSAQLIVRSARRLAARATLVASLAALAAGTPSPSTTLAQCPTTDPAPTTTRVSAVPNDAYLTLRVGSLVRDSLGANDETLDDGSRVREYDLALTEGQRVTLVLTAQQLEAVLMISLDEDDTALFSGASAAALRFQLMRGDEDEDGRTQIRVTFTAPATGTFHIAVNGMDEDSLGAFQLAVQAAGPVASGRTV
jgi:hypothetical protein